MRQNLLELARKVKINKEKLIIRKIDQDKIPKILAYIFSIRTIEASESDFEQQSENPGGAENSFLRDPCRSSDRNNENPRNGQLQIGPSLVQLSGGGADRPRQVFDHSHYISYPNSLGS